MTISFNKKGYDPFIDFLKAYSILVVVFCHGFPYLKEIGYPFWGGQIPLFLLIQVFHCYKREPKPLNWNVLAKRIIIPFILIELVIFTILLLVEDYDSIKAIIMVGVIGGGYGPGSYYPWIFIQMSIVIPILRPILDKLGKEKSFIVFIVLSEGIEIICSVIEMPDSIYRLLCLRYIMLIWFGWMWAKEGIKLNITTLLLSMMSLCAIVYLAYFNFTFEPWLYSTAWTTHRWPCYFWMSIMLVVILYQFYVFLIKNDCIIKATKILAAASYEIFLMQIV